MKKIYFLFSALTIFSYSHAQLTLTKAANEPVIGESIINKGFDSVGVVPKNTGAGLSWNFGSYVQNTVTTVGSYSNISSVAGSSLFPAATMVENGQNGDKLMWKSATSPTTQLEFLGVYNSGGAEINLSSNPAIVAIWPMSMGSSITDVGSGTLTLGTATGVANNTITTLGSGTGTLVLPGNVSMSNILQVKDSQTLVALGGTGLTAFTIAINSTNYSYYHSSQKYPLLRVSYENQVQTSMLGPTVTTTAKIEVNNNVFTGLNDKNFDATFQIFPNPATDQFHVNLTNNSLENGSMDIYNSVGQLAQHIDLGNGSTLERTVSLNQFKSGIYIVKTTLGNKSSTRKLIIE